MKDSVYAFIRGYLNDIKSDELADKDQIINDFQRAGETNDPVHVLRAYSRSSTFTALLNMNMAKNACHAFTFYCTKLNCNVLARTHNSTQAFVTILFHPKLKEYLCKETLTVYRGDRIDDEDVLRGYENGSTIITTTLLSTSKNCEVAEIFSSVNPNKPSQISLLCRYQIHNYRRIAVDMEKFSIFPDEKEVLIYPYVPFRIVSFTKTILEPTGHKRIEVDLEEINDNENDLI